MTEFEKAQVYKCGICVYTNSQTVQTSAKI